VRAAAETASRSGTLLIDASPNATASTVDSDGFAPAESFTVPPASCENFYTPVVAVWRR
jgi:hypothetical protein